MSEEQIEPGELTERFRAFSESVDPQPRALPVPLIIGVAVAVAVLVVVGLLWLLLAA
jgi:hypothetical protein